MAMIVVYRIVVMMKWMRFHALNSIQNLQINLLYIQIHILNIVTFYLSLILKDHKFKLLTLMDETKHIPSTQNYIFSSINFFVNSYYCSSTFVQFFILYNSKGISRSSLKK